jgi:hypothetical protein
MFGSLFVITIYLLTVLTPVLIPATIHAVHAVRDWRPTFQPRRAANFPRRMASPRLAVPAAA